MTLKKEEKEEERIRGKMLVRRHTMSRGLKTQFKLQSKDQAYKAADIILLCHQVL